MSERGAPMSAVAFRRMVTRLGPAAKMPFGIHPHMLRHSTGFKLANQGVDTRSLQHYLGHCPRVPEGPYAATWEALCP